MRRGKGKTLEGEGPPFRRRVQRGKAAIGRFCFAKSPLLPPNLPQPPRTSPMSPPFRKWKFVSLFRMAGTWGKFFVALGGEAFCRVRLSRPIGRWDAVGYDTRVRHILQTHSTHKTGAKPHHIKHSHLPSKPKTSPQDPHHQKDKANLRSCNGGGLVGKFGVGQGGLEGR